MKKSAIILGTAAAALALASCNKQELVPAPAGDGVQISFNAQIDEATKTTLDPSTYEVAWEDGDVIYVITESGPWGTPWDSDKTTNSIKDFIYNAGTGLFSSESTIAPGTYNFWAMYDGSKSQKSYFRQDAVSAKIASEQTQDCTAPTAHIKTNDNLFGKVSATIEAESAPSLDIEMVHTGVLMQVNFTNNTGAPVELTKMQMTFASGDLAGVFNVDLSTTPISTSTNTSHGSAITLNITNGTVAAGATQALYFVMAPITDYTGEVSFRFTDSASKTYTQKKTVATPITFAANSYNTANLAFDEADAVLLAGYQKVTSEPADWSGTYIFVDESSWRAFNGVDANYGYVSVSEAVSGIITGSYGDCEMVITALSGGYSIKVTSGTNINKYIYGTSGSNKVNFGATAVENTITWAAEGVTIKGVASGTANTTFVYNDTSGTERFRYYKDGTISGSGSAHYHLPQLYKKL